jgi:hypothetical protein
MMGKSLNYAYPQRFANGGGVSSGGVGPDAYVGPEEGPVFQVVNPGPASGVEVKMAKPRGTTYFEDNSVRDNTGHDMVLVTFDNGEKVYTNKAVAEAMIPGNNFASRDDYNKAFVDFTTDQSNFDQWNDKQVSYDQVIQEDPAVQANRAAIQAYAEAINAGTTAMDGGIGSLVQENQGPGNTQQQQAASGASEQKSTSYAFVDAAGNSYSMGDNRPGHDGTSLERAIANVQEYYDFAPGSFTVSVPSEERLVGTYDSASGSFQAATSDMRDLNGFSALPGLDLFPDSTPVFSRPPGVDPMVPAPVIPSPVVNPVFTPSPVVNPVFTPSPDNTAFTPPPPPPVEGRTYGTSPTSYSAGMVGDLSPFYRPPSGKDSVPTAYGAPINTQQVMQQASLNSPFRRQT